MTTTALNSIFIAKRSLLFQHFLKITLFGIGSILLSGSSADAWQADPPEPAPVVDESLLTLQKQLKTPRDAVDTFLQAMANNDFELAYECFDLSELDAETATAKQRTCLLYTSPSPRDQRGSRMPSSA